MKKSIFTFLIALFSCAFIYADDLATFVLDDFESGAVGFTETVNINPPESFNATVENNPLKDAVNGSEKAWKWERLTDTDNWAGFWASLTNPVPEGYHRIEIKYYRTDANSQLRIKCEGSATAEFNPVSPATKTNEWEVITFDLTANGIKNVNVLAIFPDYSNTLAVGTVSYIDGITFVYDPTVEPPTKYTLFSDSDNDRFHDQSWSPMATEPSTLVLEHWEAAGMAGGDKFPVVTSPVKDGSNALKLQWKSAEGGDWSILLASVGWIQFDLTEMNYLKFWVNSSAALAKTALPKLHLEAFAGGTTGKISMENYLSADLAANTWTEVIIPLADFWVADTEFTAKDNIKGVFFSQNAADGVEHTLYLDEFAFDQNESSGLSTVKKENLNVYYANGTIYVPNYDGNIQVIDLTGKTLYSFENVSGAISCPLENGIYVVKTEGYAGKLFVK